MRVVIDTSVLVSAAIRDRLPERVVLWCVAQEDVEWLVSPEILDEYINVVNRPKFQLSAATIAWWMDLLSRRTRVILPAVDIPFPRDRKDARFLMCAESGGADALITGDGDFSEARSLVSATIMNVRQFAERFAPDLIDESAMIPDPGGQTPVEGGTP